MNAHIETPRDEIAAFCKRWRVAELALFGSVLREDFGPESDVEVLIRFHPEVQHSLLDMARMRQELSRMLGREVDLVERTVVERSRNYIRRKSILQTAEKLVWRRPSLRS